MDHIPTIVVTLIVAVCLAPILWPGGWGREDLGYFGRDDL